MVPLDKEPTRLSMKHRIALHFRSDNPNPLAWEKKIRTWIAQNYPETEFVKSRPRTVIVLGGDGTILEAARKYQATSPLLFGLNLGHVGFLASAREPKRFLPALACYFAHDYHVVKRMLVHATVERSGKQIFEMRALNEIAVKSMLGMVELDVTIDGYRVQRIRGGGVMVATATGSTAYNLSAHGPVVMPDIKCMVLTEIMDHNVPTPSIVVKRNRSITITVKEFRERGLLITPDGASADVVVSADGESIFPLHRGDLVRIRPAAKMIRIAEFEKDYFFKSLQEKFSFS